MDTRQNLLHDWLTHDCGFNTFSLQAMTGDASFRRYFRVLHNEQSWVAMDAPPDRENCVAYIAITKALRKLGLNSPEVYKENLTAGFLLITDFGDKQLLGELNTSNMLQLYGEALDTLAMLQACKSIEGWNVPMFTANFMYQELEWFKEWFLQSYLGLHFSSATESMLANTFDFLATLAASQSKVFMHRDYHSANLMVLPQNKIGVLDFQDAFIGPVTYDLVSLLRDCYIDWPEDVVTKLALSYKQRIHLSVSDELFLRWFDGMGLQRHMKALLTFSRKYKRDANPHYLKHIPRTLNYISSISKSFPECRDFCDFLHHVILPTYEKVSLVCAE
jgi:aminoglycoside/choline kinase family phosphotransferase